MATVQELRDRTPEGYNLAMLVPTDYDIGNACEDFMTDEAVPVLKMATGALGVLRSMDMPGKRPGIIGRLASEGTEQILLHLVFSDTECVLHWIKFKIHKGD